MINGDLNEFMDYLHIGFELIFVYDGKKYFLQGLTVDGNNTLFLDRWEPTFEASVWKCTGVGLKYPVDEFLEARIWNGKKFMEVEQEIEWVDC